jgi:hypothetical protein
VAVDKFFSSTEGKALLGVGVGYVAGVMAAAAGTQWENDEWRW